MPKQGTRLIIFCIYISILLIINYCVFQQILPLNGSKGLWFYSGLASILLGNMLVTPFYTKPVDAISYSVAAIIALYSVNDWDKWITIDKTAFVFALAFCVIVLIFAFATILTKDSSNSTGQKWSATFRNLSDSLGNERLIFGMVTLFALIVFHRESALELLTITLAWIIMITKPEQFFLNIYNRMVSIWGSTTQLEIVGNIVAYQTPGLILVRQKDVEPLQFGTILVLKDSTRTERIAMVMDCIGQDDRPLIRAIIIDISVELKDTIKESLRLYPENIAIKCDEIQYQDASVEIVSSIKKLQENCLGFVAQETSIEHLYFDVIQEKQLEEGNLVEVLINGQPVLYQVVNGVTKEENVFQKNTYGFARVKAQKIGSWDISAKRFLPAKWIPTINSPVFKKNASSCQAESRSIGHFPGSDCNIYR